MADSQALHYHVTLNAGHAIYKAHFPGMPITPGVCIIQMARELLELHSGKRLEIRSVKTAKFLNIVNPEVTPELLFVITLNNADEDCLGAKVEVEWGGVTYAKLTVETKWQARTV